MRLPRLVFTRRRPDTRLGICFGRNAERSVREGGAAEHPAGVEARVPAPPLARPPVPPVAADGRPVAYHRSRHRVPQAPPPALYLLFVVVSYRRWSRVTESTQCSTWVVQHFSSSLLSSLQRHHFLSVGARLQHCADVCRSRSREHNTRELHSVHLCSVQCTSFSVLQSFRLKYCTEMKWNEISSCCTCCSPQYLKCGLPFTLVALGCLGSYAVATLLITEWRWRALRCLTPMHIE